MNSSHVNPQGLTPSMRFPTVLVLILAPLIFTSGCKTKVDIKVWQALNSNTSILESTEFNFHIESSDASLLGYRKLGPWYPTISVITDTKKAIEVLSINIHSKQGKLITFTKRTPIILRLIRNDGKWTGQWPEEKSPISINPQYYNDQLITVTYEIKIGEEFITLTKQFIPNHIIGEKSINIFTQ